MTIKKKIGYQYNILYWYIINDIVYADNYTLKIDWVSGSMDLIIRIRVNIVK